MVMGCFISGRVHYNQRSSIHLPFNRVYRAMIIRRFFLATMLVTCLRDGTVGWTSESAEAEADAPGSPSHTRQAPLGKRDLLADGLGGPSYSHRVIAQRWRRLRPVVAAPAGNNALASGIDRDNFDPSVRFQDDLYRAVNGTWMKKAEIPADRADYGAFTALIDKAEADLREIIQQCAPPRTIRPAPSGKRWATSIPPTWTRPARKNWA